MSKDVLLHEILEGIVTYPYKIFDNGTLYPDLDISHQKISLIIKVSHHKTIDVITKAESIIEIIELLFQHEKSYKLIRYRKGE